MNNLQASAQRHGINLRHGTTNPGTGDCAFESIIQNINDRPCFKEKFTMSINYYRRIFVTDMANRTVNTHFNFLTPQEWHEKWKEMLEPGAYERGIFGDLMLPGIACGVRKILLIFNTNPDTPHDPIYVVDPSDFNVSPDTNIPIILAYNMSHYESMEPLTEIDTQKSIDLARDYMNGQYRYKRKDLPFLLNIGASSSDDLSNEANKQNPLSKKNTSNKIKANFEKLCSSLNDDDFVPNMESNNDKEQEHIDEDVNEPEKNNMAPTQEHSNHKAKNPKKANTTKEDSNPGTNVDDLCYRLKNNTKELPIRQIDGKMECPFCKIVVKNVSIHFERALQCGDKIDKNHFTTKFHQYKREIDKGKNKIYKQRYKEKNPVKYKESNDKDRNRRKEEDPEKYKKAQEEAR